nr:MAG TPA: hypothetical protein [Caudoviricetes sp.]
MLTSNSEPSWLSLPKGYPLFKLHLRAYTT